jgi:hypothetical protein
MLEFDIQSQGLQRYSSVHPSGKYFLCTTVLLEPCNFPILIGQE